LQGENNNEEPAVLLREIVKRKLDDKYGVIIRKQDVKEKVTKRRTTAA